MMLSTSRPGLLHAWRTCKPARRMTTGTSAVRDDLRALLRETAQPVAVVTALMDPSTPPDAPPRPGAPPTASPFHGATLSSFSSISMDPHPLVAFSLRIPSRMATALTTAHAAGSLYTHMVINILSARQAETALRFSRVDLYPEPFAGLRHSLTEEGLPVLDGSVGAMSCRLVAASWPLHDLESLTSGGKGATVEWKGEGVASELFIAEVLRVEHTPAEGDTRPLLYHRRGYVTTSRIESKPGSKPSS
ncbi:flavin reductase like domain-containing protein [Trametes elegans]|nr:flavin reductase like domain-containing protein [Trametes elegans]